MPDPILDKAQAPFSLIARHHGVGLLSLFLAANGVSMGTIGIAGTYPACGGRGQLVTGARYDRLGRKMADPFRDGHVGGPTRGSASGADVRSRTAAVYGSLVRWQQAYGRSSRANGASPAGG